MRDHDTITGKLVRVWLIENYAPRFKENGGGVVNSSNTIENTEIALNTQCIVHILLSSIFLSGKH